MSIVSSLFNRFGDLFNRPNENSLANGLLKLKERKNRLHAAIMGHKRLFDGEYVEFERRLRKMVSGDELPLKEYRKIKDLCLDFLNNPREKIEQEKFIAMESARLGTAKGISVGIVRLAGIALEIIDKKDELERIEKEIFDLQQEISRIRRAS